MALTRVPRLALMLDYGLSEDNVQHGKDQGYVVNVPTDREVQLDIDDVDDLVVLKQQLDILRQYYSIEEIRRTVSPGGNAHVYLRFENPLTPAERIALQASLGSDRKRELLSLVRLFNGEDNPTVLYENPEPEAGVIDDDDIPF